MGWMISNPSDYKYSLKRGKEYLRERLFHPATTHLYDDALVSLSEYYALGAPTTDPTSVFLLVALVRFYRTGEIGIKTMDEDMGPRVIRCPVRILDKADKLRPVELGSTAYEWRQACREYHARKSTNRKGTTSHGA
jgi:hypothetical protein